MKFVSCSAPAALLVLSLLSVALPLRAQTPNAQPSVYDRWTHGPFTKTDTFPIAVWLQDPANAARYKAAGINLYVSLWQGPTETQLAALKAADMPVICAQNAVGLAHREDSTIVGWMHGDEPDNAQPVTDAASGKQTYGPCIPPARIVADYARLRAADPTRPILLNLGQGVANDQWVGRGVGAKLEDYATYVQGGDVISFDVYPVAGLDRADSANFLWYVPKGIDRLAQWTAGRKPVWNCIECTRIDGDRKATTAQVRAEAWMALVHGSKGLIYFVHQFKPAFNEHALLDDPEMLAAVTTLNQQIQTLAPVLNSPAISIEKTTTVQSSNKEVPVDLMVKRQGKALYLFAVGMRNASTTATFALSGLLAQAQAEVLGEKRSVSVQNGRFTDAFRPYEVHLYRILPIERAKTASKRDTGMKKPSQPPPAPAEHHTDTADTNVPCEIAFTAQRVHADPFLNVVMDVLFTDPAGQTRRVPAFWAGGAVWKVRYASPLAGTHRWRSACSDGDDPGLHGVEGTLAIRRYRGTNPLFRHGPVRVAPDKQHFEYGDGTPFFWLGDTWWMGLCHRLHWPDEFQQLTADRKAKGFNIIQIVAGLYPDMPPFDPRGANEAGFPWEADYARIRPEYFDAADKRLRYLVDQGVTPCLVGAWGYFLPWMGQAKMQAHWRYLIARYAAWPVVWCAAGEANLPWYLAPGFPYDDREQVHGWTQVLRFIRATDPFRRPLTIHPTAINRYTARNATDDVSLLDFDMLQTPHGQKEAVPITVRAARESVAAHPIMPVIDGEASYERLSDSLPTEWTRAMFWLCLMNGAKGHTYGANGIWQMNRKGQPHGASPHGGNYGVIAWDDAMQLPGSQQMGYGKRFFEALPWTHLTPMPETVEWEGAGKPAVRGDWIWFPEGDPKRDAPTEARYFRRVFTLPATSALRSATLAITADDRFTVWLNGQEIGSGANWSAFAVFDLASALRKGRNVLAVRAENLKAPVPLNPAGLSAALDLDFTDGSRQTLRTDAQWQASRVESEGWRSLDFDEAGWSPSLVTASFGAPPWGSAGVEDPLFAPQACGIGDRLRAVYVLVARPIVVRALRPDAEYRLTFFDPVIGRRAQGGVIHTDAQGKWHGSPPASGHDYVVLLEAR